MSTTANNRGKYSGKSFLDRSRQITQHHLEMVAAECLGVFQEMLTNLWLEENILESTEAKAIPRELAAHLRKHYSLDKIQSLCAFYIDFFSGGLAGASDGQLSFTSLEFEGLQHFEQKFAHRLPEADRTKLHELVRILKKAGPA